VSQVLQTLDLLLNIFNGLQVLKDLRLTTALLGAIMSGSIMFYTAPIKAAASLLIVVFLFFYIHLRGNKFWSLIKAPPRSWGDVSQALMYHQVRKYLLRLDPRKDHIKFWRPQILLMIENPRSSLKLINFIDKLKKSGLYVIGNVVIGDWREEVLFHLILIFRHKMLLNFKEIF